MAKEKTKAPAPNLGVYNNDRDSLFYTIMLLNKNSDGGTIRECETVMKEAQNEELEKAAKICEAIAAELDDLRFPASISKKIAKRIRGLKK